MMVAKQQDDNHELKELVRTMLIAQLGLAGVPQRHVRAIARCDLNRVTEVMKHLKKGKAEKKGAE